MKTSLWIIALLSLGLGCAAPTSLGEPSEEGTYDISGDDAEVVESDPVEPLAIIEIAPGHEVRFVPIEVDGTTAGVFLAEISDGRNSVSAIEIARAELGEGATAGDLFVALAEEDATIPEALSPSPELDRPIGWARELVTEALAAHVPYRSTPACTNSTFTASTPYGILSHNATWLDRHPWIEYSHFLGQWDNVYHYTPRLRAELARYDVREWRGKLCYEAIPCAAGEACHNAVQGSGESPSYLAPIIAFQYRRPGNPAWYLAGGQWIEVPLGAVRQITWAWFGSNNEQWDWRMNTARGQAQDWLDYMRSYEL